MRIGPPVREALIRPDPVLPMGRVKDGRPGLAQTVGVRRVIPPPAFTALAIAGMPSDLIDNDTIRNIFRGGAEMCVEAECSLLGGHTIKNPEPIYGLAVTGIVHPERHLANAHARPDEHLVLTKPLGSGIVSTGIKKLLSYLEKVTGSDFVDLFVDAIGFLYQTKGHFTSAIEFQKELGKKDFSNWFLVTSAEHHKVGEALHLLQGAGEFMHDDNFLCVNKCHKPFLDNWHPDDTELNLSVLRVF